MPPRTAQWSLILSIGIFVGTMMPIEIYGLLRTLCYSHHSTHYSPITESRIYTRHALIAQLTSLLCDGSYGAVSSASGRTMGQRRPRLICAGGQEKLTEILDFEVALGESASFMNRAKPDLYDRMCPISSNGQNIS